MLGQRCITWNGLSYPPGTQGIYILDSAGNRPTEWMETLPYPFVPIVRAVIVRAAGDGDYTVSIDQGQNELNLASPPYYQSAVSTPQSWYKNQGLIGLTGDPAAGHPLRKQQTLSPPIIMDRRYDSIWIDSNNYGKIGNAIGIALCWDADLAEILNAGHVESGWLTSAGLVICAGSQSSWQGYTAKIVVAPGKQSASRSIELINGGGSQARVTFAAGDSNTPIVKAYIGTTVDAMMPLAFGAAPSVTIPANTQLTSDPVSFVVNENKHLMVSMLFGAGATARYANPIPGWATWYKNGDDAGNNSIAGYTLGGAGPICVVRVESYH